MCSESGRLATSISAADTATFQAVDSAPSLYAS